MTSFPLFSIYLYSKSWCINSNEVGFLALYKKHNPKGKIIAVNLIQPKYLGNDDILMVEMCRKLCLI
ncbi:hypothetical protein [Wolbachia endosymbiont of Litomosoides brasiliensis]|uniref:hypothetical protein n=1 Tax=Wolbachia endosymbiont of Litomosoides brasiliensis TaxID=1812117 RepID=UPI00158D931A|nr:hypothetical protein [Wolbachia endosymbiont of Litomosoides brasiliensis]